MILTPISRDQLPAALDRLAARLDEPSAREAFASIRATSPDRAVGPVAEAHRALESGSTVGKLVLVTSAPR